MSVHRFHIPVMATGFTIDTPLKVARFGIDSVVSLVDDALIEQMREHVSRDHGLSFTPIEEQAIDSRARRITAYLDLLHELLQQQMTRLRSAAFEAGSELVRYFQMLPDSPLRRSYQTMCSLEDSEERVRLQRELRAQVVAGAIDVNIMTKLDRDLDRQGRPFAAQSSDALSAMRGFLNSKASGSLVLSAGMNRRLFSYMAEFGTRFLQDSGEAFKGICLKVSDFRSALVQGKFLSKLGLAVTEFRIESGLNCGGHAFGSQGQLLGPILQEFHDKREWLQETLGEIRDKARAALGLPLAAAPARLTVQGGLGEAEEAELLLHRYGLDGSGWGSAFLFVPEVVNIDRESLAGITKADVEDIYLSDSSPLGVPFWSYRGSASEQRRRLRIHDQRPGATCPKGYLVSNTEFTAAPLCTASHAYQKRKLQQIAAAPDMTQSQRTAAEEKVLCKACICHDLAGGVTGPLGIDPLATTSLCCGPNTAYFQQSATLEEMCDHIYGRRAIPLRADRPHMLLKEFSLNLTQLRKDLAQQEESPTAPLARAIQASRIHLAQGAAHYRELAADLPSATRASFQQGLKRLEQELRGYSLKEPAPSPATTPHCP